MSFFQIVLLIFVIFLCQTGQVSAEDDIDMTLSETEKKAAFIASRIEIQFIDVETQYNLCVEFDSFYKNPIFIEGFKDKNKHHLDNANKFIWYLLNKLDKPSSEKLSATIDNANERRRKRTKDNFIKETNERKKAICLLHNYELLTGHWNIPDNEDTSIFNKINYGSNEHNK
jgi:hypothetical protein